MSLMATGLSALGGLFGASQGGMFDNISSAVGELGSDFMSGIASGSMAADRTPGDLQSSVGAKSALQGSNTPPSAQPAPVQASGSQAQKLNLATELGKAANDVMTGTISNFGDTFTSKLTDKVFKQDPVALAKTQGKAANAYMEAAYPGTNVWDKLGQAGAPAGTVSAGIGAGNARQLQKTGNTQQTGIVGSQNATSIANAGLNSATSRANTHDVIMQRQPLIEAQTADTLAAASLKSHQAGQSDAAAEASRASAVASHAAAGASHAQAGYTRAQTQTAEQLRPGQVKAQNQTAENLTTPGHLGQIYQTGKNVPGDALKYLQQPAGSWDMSVGEAWQGLKGYYDKAVDNIKSSGGILGSQAKKDTQRK